MEAAAAATKVVVPEASATEGTNLHTVEEVAAAVTEEVDLITTIIEDDNIHRTTFFI